MSQAMKRVLFLCTGNYYRSRFAEHLFNHLAQKEGLPWRATSRGLQAWQTQNIGPISRHALDGLESRGISLVGQHRCSIQLSEADLEQADLVIAVKEAEHRAMVREQFPDWEERIEYWHIDDLDCAVAEDALACLEQQILDLIVRLTSRDAETGAAALDRPTDKFPL